MKLAFLLLIPILIIAQGCSETHSERGMFMSNNQHTGKFTSASIKSEPTILWKIKTGGQVISSPVVVDNTVFVGSEDGKLYAIVAATGDKNWEYETGGPINSTPLVANGRVMFLSYDGFFYSLNQSTGKLDWKFQTGGEEKFNVKDYFNGSFKPDFWDFYLSSAVAKNNLVYFGSSDANIYALDIGSGEMVWKFKTGGSIHSSPAIYENSIVVGSWDSRIYCLNATTGAENWTYTTGRDTAQYIWLGIQASTSIEAGAAYVGSRDAKIYALNVESGDTLWTNDNFDRSWMPSSMAIGKENIYTGSSDSFSFFSISRKTGTINYATKTNAYTFSSPAIDDEMAYIGSANGRLYGIDLDEGIIEWEFQTIGSKTDTIGAFDLEGKMDGEKFTSLMEGIQDMPTLSTVYEDIFIGTGAILSSPTISNQIIYFGSSDGYVYAISDKSQN